MLRRIVAASHRPIAGPALRRPLFSAERRCTTTTSANSKSGTLHPNQASSTHSSPTASSSSSSSSASSSSVSAHAQKAEAGAAGGKAASRTTTTSTTTNAASAHGPQRKDWRTHKDIVYVKGVPAKGSMFKLPWSEQLIIYLVFSIAGMGAVYLVRPQIRYLCHNGFLGLTEDAGWKNGPWLYRLLYVCVMFPCYSLILFCAGACFGRRIWFSFMLHKMWSRFMTKKASQRLTYLLDIQHY